MIIIIITGRCTACSLMCSPYRRLIKQGAPGSWKIMEFKKTIFHVWKVVENSKGHGKSWKMMIMSCNFYNCTEQFCESDTNYKP